MYLSTFAVTKDRRLKRLDTQWEYSHTKLNDSSKHEPRQRILGKSKKRKREEGKKPERLSAVVTH